MKICILGFDGSGKTALARRLVAYFQQKGEGAVYFHPGRARNNWLLIGKLLWEKRHLVCDRGYYDSLVGLYPPFLLRYRRLTRWLFAFFVFLLPKFDRVLLLEITFATAQARKDEGLSLAEYQKRQKLYQILRRWVKIEALNGEQNQHQVFRRALAVINNDLVFRIKQLRARFNDEIGSLC